MSTNIDKLISEIRSLSKEEKLRVLGVLLTDLKPIASENDEVWIEEARERWQAYKAGRLDTVSYEELRRKYKQ